MVEIFVFVETGVSHGLTGSHQSVLGVEVKLAELLTVDMVGAVKTLHLAGELGLEEGSVEMGNWAGTGNAVDGVLPCCLDIVAEGSDGSHAGYYYSFKFHLL